MTKNILKPGWLLVLVLALMLVFSYSPVLLAQDDQEPPVAGEPEDTPEDTDEDPEADGTTSNWANAAQEQKAVNLDAALDAKVAELEADMEAIQSKLDEDDLLTDDDALKLSDEERAALEDELAGLAEDFDEAAAAALETTPESIAAMREDGMGWGQIAQELGVHPSTLGLGAANGRTNRERTTARSKTGGLPAGHGLLADGSAAVGNGLGKNKDAAGQNKNQGNAFGKDKTKSGGVGQGKGNAGGQGQGGGQGKGGGKK